MHHAFNIAYVVLSIHGVVKCDFRAAEALEREKLLASGSMSDITPHDLLQPHSDFHIRNRYLSRIGAPVRFNF